MFHLEYLLKFVTCNSEHKQELQLHDCLNRDEARRNEFVDWFFEKVCKYDNFL